MLSAFFLVPVVFRGQQEEMNYNCIVFIFL